MRPTTLFLAVLILQFSIPHISAQSIQVLGPPEEVVRRQAMESALESWHKVDSGIERGLFQKQSDEMLKRIAASAESRNKVEEARLAYLQALLDQARRQLASLASLRTGGSSIPVDEIRTSIQSRLDSLTADEMRIRRVAKEKDPAVSPDRQLLINEQLDEQLKQIANLRENLYQQKELLEKIHDGEQKESGVAQALLNHQRDIVQLLESESNRTTEERTLWQNYYTALRKLVVDHAKAKEAPRTRGNSESKAAGSKP